MINLSCGLVEGGCFVTFDAEEEMLNIRFQTCALFPVPPHRVPGPTRQHFAPLLLLTQALPVFGVVVVDKGAVAKAASLTCTCSSSPIH